MVGLGLKASPLEPTLFSGWVQLGQKWTYIIALPYVDDLLIVSDSQEGVEFIHKSLSAVLKVKVTGRLHEDGQLEFLGRLIKLDGNNITLGVKPEYVRSVFSAFGWTEKDLAKIKPVATTPDIRALYDAEDPESPSPSLSAEAAGRFRSWIGKIGWLTQTRTDITYFHSMLSRGQAAPRMVHEDALRKFLRWFVGCPLLDQIFPAGNGETLEEEGSTLVAFRDSNWGSESSTGRKSTSGGVIYVVAGSLWFCVKGYSRLQTVVALSSAEAELFAIAEAAKEIAGLGQLASHIWGELTKPLAIYTDSASARQIAGMEGFLRRMRHVDIRLCFIQAGHLEYLLTLFADDTLCQWEINDEAQLTKALRMISFILEFLDHHGLKANLDKTVILAKFVGSKHAKTWSKYTERHPERGLCVRVPAGSGPILLPLKVSHKYLGVQLSYRHMVRDTVNYRIKCAQSSFARLNTALKRTSKLSLRGRIRLWQAIVHSTLRYGICSTGLDQQNISRYKGLFMRHLRAISDSPVHLTRESNDALLIRVGVDCPLYTLSQEAMRRHRCTLQQEAFQLQPPGLCGVWERVLASFGQPQLATPSDGAGPLRPDSHQRTAALEPNSATTCLASASHAPVNASVVSAATPPSATPETAIDAGTSSSMLPTFITDRPATELEPSAAVISLEQDLPHDMPSRDPPHSGSGSGSALPSLPGAASQTHVDFRCPICDYVAGNTQSLRYHMTTRHALSERNLALAGGDSFRFEDHAYAGMPTCRHCRRAFTGIPQLKNHIVAQVCPILHGVTPSGRDYGQLPDLPHDANTDSVPLRDRASTMLHLREGGWLALARSPGFKEVALEHCPLCHLWVANASGQVKKHITQKHKDIADVVKQVITECRQDSHFELGSPCRLCHRSWKGPKIRHRESCTVLFASCLLAALLLPSGQSVQSPGQDGGGANGDDGVRGSLQQHVPARGNEEVQAGTHGNCNGTVGNPSQRQGQGSQGQGQQQGSPATVQQDFAADGIIGWTGHRVSCSEQLRPLAGMECQLLGALETGLQLPSSSVGAAPSNGHHEPVVDEARAGIDGSPSGHWIRNAPRGGLQGNTQASVPVQQGVLRGQVEAAPDEAHFEANSALDCLSHPKGETGETRDGAGLDDAHAQVGVAPCHGESVALPSLVPGEGSSDPRGSRSDESARSSAGSHRGHHDAAGGAPGAVSIQHDHSPHPGSGDVAGPAPPSASQLSHS